MRIDERTRTVIDSYGRVLDQRAYLLGADFSDPPPTDAAIGASPRKERAMPHDDDDGPIGDLAELVEVLAACPDGRVVEVDARTIRELKMDVWTRAQAAGRAEGAGRPDPAIDSLRQRIDELNIGPRLMDLEREVAESCLERRARRAHDPPTIDTPGAPAPVPVTITPPATSEWTIRATPGGPGALLRVPPGHSAQVTPPPYGYELVIDLRGCDRAVFNRKALTLFFETLCAMLGVERHDLHFWDYEGDEEAYAQAAPHLRGATAVQFITTSSIVVHTLDDLELVFLNIFSCAAFDPDKITPYCAAFFGGVPSSRYSKRG